ncbi:MAG: DUF424 family protein [Thermoplasmata archaeon]|nr:DUF424 family protein [Thermoplasmata archaeon]
MIIAKFHRQSGEVLLAACDSELFGKCLESEDLKLDLGTEFFNGEKVDEGEFCSMLVQATSANLVGPRTIKLAVKMEMVHPEAVIEICEVPHAMFFNL